MPEVLQEERKSFITIAAGKFRQKTDPEDPRAVKREYEKDDKTIGVKWEKVIDSWTGKIIGASFRDVDMGGKTLRMFSVEFEDAIISVGVDSEYFQDFADRLYGIDLSLTVILSPFDIKGGKVNKTTGKTRNKKGISVKQNGIKLKTAFFNGKNGSPVMAETNPSRDDWEIYWKQFKKFRVNKMEEKFAPLNSGDPISTEEVNNVFTNNSGFNTQKSNLIASDLPF